MINKLKNVETIKEIFEDDEDRIIYKINEYTDDRNILFPIVSGYFRDNKKEYILNKYTNFKYIPLNNRLRLIFGVNTLKRFFNMLLRIKIKFEVK